MAVTSGLKCYPYLTKNCFMAENYFKLRLNLFYSLKWKKKVLEKKSAFFFKWSKRGVLFLSFRVQAGLFKLSKWMGIWWDIYLTVCHIPFAALSFQWPYHKSTKCVCFLLGWIYFAIGSNSSEYKTGWIHSLSAKSISVKNLLYR